ncbi:shikimate dehydrogenase [Paraflavitalea sp. CAU 1676]|uniref:shikimate dehydrogenase family protein n=1 Tax=Paraflavitalea sp. CAU 1676 TaxID=3032598 RepID=UPI0023DBABA4|nr:shikimate dehydrogenase [Paraflavitalea sp. CAU 1676]MDF2191716.1 shikimate dehydrogenase [Paraflavitalea sp. CAU 1676]
MKQFGLIGYPLSHSFSQKFFTDKFREEHITGCVYDNFPLDNIDALRGVLEKYPNLAGLNVTIPYKEKVIPYLHHQSDVVKRIGACNCIKFVNGELHGYNTDVTGFEESLRPLLQSHHQKALVLGTGGAAKAIHFVLEKLGIIFLEVSRNPFTGRQISYEQLTPELLEQHTLIINTTPVGMYPHVEECPQLPYTALTKRHYLFDLVYNPAKTMFLQKGEEQGAVIKNGADMLVIQAEESWRIWNS